MDNDFDTPKALAVIFDFVRNINKAGGGKKAYDLLMKFDKIFCILEHKKEKISENINKLVEERETARKQKDFNKADEIRKKINKEGYIVEDTDEGPKLKRS